MVYYTDCFEFSSVRSRIGEFGFVVYFNFLHKKAIDAMCERDNVVNRRTGKLNLKVCRNLPCCSASSITLVLLSLRVVNFRLVSVRV